MPVSTIDNNDISIEISKKSINSWSINPLITAYPHTHSLSKNIIFLLDCSVSMGSEGESQDNSRLQKVKTAVSSLLDKLSPNDTFSIVSFHDQASYVISCEKAEKIAVKKAYKQLSGINGLFSKVITGLLYVPNFIITFASILVVALIAWSVMLVGSCLFPKKVDSKLAELNVVLRIIAMVLVLPAVLFMLFTPRFSMIFDFFTLDMFKKKAVESNKLDTLRVLLAITLGLMIAFPPTASLALIIGAGGSIATTLGIGTLSTIGYAVCMGLIACTVPMVLEFAFSCLTYGVKKIFKQAAPANAGLSYC